MKKTLLALLTLFTNFVFAQQSCFYDATSHNAGFSYNITISYKLLKGWSKTRPSEVYSVKLVSVTPDSRGFYYGNQRNKFYSCSEIGNNCNPNNWQQVYVGLNGQCKTTTNDKLSFSSIGEEKTIEHWTNENESCSFNELIGTVRQDGTRDLMNIIDAKERPEGNKNTQNNNSENNNPATQTSTTTSTTNSGMPANTSGNDPLAHFATDGKTQSNPMLNKVNSGPNEIDNFNKGYTQGQQIVNAATALYTNPIANISSGSGALDSFSNGYAQGQQIVDVATGLIDLFTPSPEQQKRKEEERQRVRAEAEKKVAEEKAMWADYTNSKVLDKYIAAADRGNEIARVVLMFEIFRLSEIKDMTYLVPNLKSWIDEAVKNKNLDAMNFVGYHSIYNIRPFVNLNYTKDDGLKILEEAATLNSGDAMYTLGEYYNRKKMPNWTTACKQGGSDPEKAFAFFSKAAEQNHPDAMYVLAEIYLNKYPAKKNTWFVTYNIEKNSNLGCTYMYNSLYPKDYQETIYQKFGIHFKKFRRHDVFKELSVMYENGTGCPKDQEMAKKLYGEIEKSSYEYSMKYFR
jgi:TPR repeat protein